MVNKNVWFSTNHHQPDNSQRFEPGATGRSPWEMTNDRNPRREDADGQRDGRNCAAADGWWSFGKATTNSYFWTSGSEISWYIMNDYFSVDMIYEISMTYLKHLPLSAVFVSVPVWTHPGQGHTISSGTFVVQGGYRDLSQNQLGMVGMVLVLGSWKP